MAFSRTRNFRRSGGSSRFAGRRRSNLRRPGPHKWQVSDFFVSSVAAWPSGSLSESSLVLHLASPTISLNQGAAGDDTAPVGRVLSSMARKMLIGGIVFDWGWDFTGFIDGDAATFEGFAWTGLVSDRLVTDVGTDNFFPNHISLWSPFTSDFPTAALAAGTPLNASEDANRPSHIHWRQCFSTQFGTRPVEPPGEGVLHVPLQQPVRTQRGTVNKRLRLVLDDQNGLFLHFHTLNQLNFAVSSGGLSLVRWAQGQLYWKMVF